MLRPASGMQTIRLVMRLSICVEAPANAVADVLAKHPQVKALFDNNWLHLFLLDENGHMTQRYAGDLNWTPIA